MPTEGARTIFLTINNAVNVRDILRGSVLETLRRSGHRIVVVTPAHGERAFMSEFAGDDIVIEPLVRHAPGRLESVLNRWRYVLFPELSETVKILGAPRGERSAAKKALLRSAMVVKRWIGSRRLKRAMMWANVRLFPDRHHAALFRRYRPDLVVVTEVMNLAPDLWILKRAVREGVPVLWLVRSWDNLSSKGILPAPIDRLTVWSEMMREEAVSLHGFPPHHVSVAGPPHLDIVTRLDGTLERGAFLERIGADPDKKLILYAMAPMNRADVDHEQAIIERLWQLAEAGAFAAPCQVLVRTYPLRATAIPEAFASMKGLLVDVPGRLHAAFGDRDITNDDLRHLIATLRYSDVVVNVASTIVMEAAACGTPSICVGFDAEVGKPYLQSIRRYFDYVHYRKLMACGGVRLAQSMDELVRFIEAYLANPALDREGRARVVKTMYGELDGRAGTRVASSILHFLGEVTHARPAPRGDRVPREAHPAGPAL
jgi:hypothetical protein